MAQALAAASVPLSLLASPKPTRVAAAPRSPQIPGFTSSFKCGTPLFSRVNSGKRKMAHKAHSTSIKCEQGTTGSNGLDVWLGRLAMLGFATAITIEVTTGKGLLENFGFSTPIPTLALAVTGLVGVLTAFFIFQSASRD